MKTLRERGLKRIVVNLPESWHRELKAMTALKGLSIQRYLQQALIEKIERDRQYQ